MLDTHLNRLSRREIGTLVCKDHNQRTVWLYQRSSDTFNKEEAAEGSRHCEMWCTPVDSSSAGRVA